MPTRTGRDGRTRPVDPQPGRKRIATAMLADPLASTRRIARQTGTAAGTVRDVRRRSAESSGLLREDGESCPPKVSEVPADAASRACWAGDTACVSTEAGDRFARWIDATDITNEDCERYVDGPPLSRLYEIVAEANDRAARWAEFAAALENRARQEGSARPPE